MDEDAPFWGTDGMFSMTGYLSGRIKRKGEDFLSNRANIVKAQKCWRCRLGMLAGQAGQAGKT